MGQMIVFKRPDGNECGGYLAALGSKVGVLLPGASSPRRQTMDFGINYCPDGQPPQSLK